MPKYLVTAKYSPEGTRGVISGGGGTARVKAIETLLESVGGTVESFYFAFGGTDAYVIVDAPDNVSVAAVLLTIRAAGAVETVDAVTLLTPEEIDEAAKRTVRYQPPGA
jgi:uncharacterized protein with GYD domain